MATVKVARSDRAVTVSNFSERVDLPWIKRRRVKLCLLATWRLTSLRLFSTPPNRGIFTFKCGSPTSRDELPHNVGNRAIAMLATGIFRTLFRTKVVPQGGKKSAAASGSPFDP